MQPATWLAGDSAQALALGAQQLRAIEVFGALQQDLAVGPLLAFLHWQLPPVPQLPQQLFADAAGTMQPWPAQIAVQSDVCPHSVLNILSTSKAAIED